MVFVFSQWYIKPSCIFFLFWKKGVCHYLETSKGIFLSLCSFTLRITFRYFRNTENDVFSSHIHGKIHLLNYDGVHHECERREYHLLILIEYLRISLLYISFISQVKKSCLYLQSPLPTLNKKEEMKTRLSIK